MDRHRVLVASLVVLAGWTIGCPPGKDTAEDALVCEDFETRCNDEGNFESCYSEEWRLEGYCPLACDDHWGCVACNPDEFNGLGCSGNDVAQCQPDGTLGAVVEVCSEDQSCFEGECVRACTTEGVDVIYTVDTSQRLISFDPRILESGGNPFEVVGTLRCHPEASNVPGWGGGSVTPFSMSVDRKGWAWVLYTSGEIFWVDIHDASCELSPFERMQPGTIGTWALFGMGFATDAPDSDAEHLYLAGGAADPAPGGMFGVVDSATLGIQTRGTLPLDVENSPEFTGTGKAELFAYFPGTTSIIRQLDRETGAQIGADIEAGSIEGGVSAWAFAHWGGKFYIFVTDGYGNSTVRRSDRETGLYEGVIMQNLPYRIVGAGVSTCAPTAFGD